MDGARRLHRDLRRKLSLNKLDAFLVSGFAENRYYLTGFTGDSGYLRHLPIETILFVDSRLRRQAKLESPRWEVCAIRTVSYRPGQAMARD